MSSSQTSREPQYQVQFETLAERGPVELGPTASHVWRTDPRRLGILLARYKFCAKMLAGKSSALEVGCGDGFGLRVVLQEVGSIYGVDFDPLFVARAEAHAAREGLNCSFGVVDITRDAPAGRFDAAYSLDVIEHIPRECEHAFMRNVCGALVPAGVCILGTPNITSQAYASQWSQEGHINCKSAALLKEMMIQYFENVFLFSMNDEVVHTGFYPMAHYLFGMGVGLKR